MKETHNSWDTVKELFRCESPKDAMIAEHLFNKIASEYAMLKKQLEVSNAVLEKIKESRFDWHTTACLADEALAEIKRIGGGE